jgi:hypothetical protein
LDGVDHINSVSLIDTSNPLRLITPGRVFLRSGFVPARDLEANAIEIRMRATRRLNQLRVASKETVGLKVAEITGL